MEKRSPLFCSARLTKESSSKEDVEVREEETKSDVNRSDHEEESFFAGYESGEEEDKEET